MKYLEATGARVVVLKYDDNIDTLLSLLEKTNGLFIPSYNEESHIIPRMNAVWHQAVQDLYTRSLELNQDSTFPVWISGTSVAAFFGIGNL